MQDSLEASTLGVNIQQQLGVVQRDPLNKYMSLNTMGGRGVCVRYSDKHGSGVR